MKKEQPRMIMYAKDVQLITGKSLRTARRIIALIKKKYNRQNTIGISIEDFCSYYALQEAKVRMLLV